ncbi:MAG: hypothetical protein E7H54_05620 [Clostridium perfringens]|uniref:hypothetical protein n=1 Tax=Clostridium perfringens TaxID=1502 RepID=UPI0024BCDDD0|nr:hypothetical protein [Clostridium perfringens]MDU8988643.1 hypothetical protein [Clostridium perfringens]
MNIIILIINLVLGISVIISGSYLHSNTDEKEIRNKIFIAVVGALFSLVCISVLWETTWMFGFAELLAILSPIDITSRAISTVHYTSKLRDLDILEDLFNILQDIHKDSDENQGDEVEKRFLKYKEENKISHLRMNRVLKRLERELEKSLEDK